MTYSLNVLNLEASATLEMAQKARQLQEQGYDVISLSLGEPDIPPPASVIQAVQEAASSQWYHYTPTEGVHSLKLAIIDYISKNYNTTYTPDEVMASAGAKQALYNAFLALLNPEDEVIIPAPYWVSYPQMIHLVQARAVTVTTQASNRFLLTPEELKQAITPNTKLFIMNSPSNPTGQMYSQQELEGLASVLRQNPHVWICSDDIYNCLAFEKEAVSLIQVAPDLKDRYILINGLSKSHSLQGWRMGYAAAPATLIALMKNIQSQTTSNPCSLVQAAAIAALKEDPVVLHQRKLLYQARHQLMLEGLNQINDIEVLPAQGAFYLFVNVQKAMSRFNLTTDNQFAQFVLEKSHVALVPGSAFGAPGYLRLSFAQKESLLRDAIIRLKKLLGQKIK